MSYKKYPTPKQLASELAGGKIFPVYVFIGEEEGEKDKYIKKITEMVFRGVDQESRAVGNFHAEMDEFPGAVDFALSRSMFSEKKVCVVRNLDRLPLGKESQLLLKEAVNSLPESHVMIMTSDKNSLPRGFGQEESERIRVYHFWRMFEKDLISYIRDRLEQTKMPIEPSAVECLLELLGRDIRKIDEALEILVNYGPAGPVTAETVADLIQDQQEATLSDFINGVYSGRTDTLPIVKKLLDNGIHELAVLSGLIRQAEQIETFHGRELRGDSHEEILKDLGVPPRRQRDFVSMASSTPPERIKKMITLLYRADYGLKSRRHSREFIAHPLVELLTEWTS